MQRFVKVLSLVGTVLLSSGAMAPAAYGGMMLSLVPTTPTVVSPGDTVDFDVVLTGLDGLSPGNAIFSFSLNFGACSGNLTNAGTDFSPFAFNLDPALAGGMAFDDNAADDGHVEYEISLIPADPSLTLGTLSIVAPSPAGTYTVDFQQDPADPFGAGTFVLIDDGSLFGLVAPGDPDLSTVGGEFRVESTSAVPEPTSLALLACGGLVLVGVRLRKRRTPAG